MKIEDYRAIVTGAIVNISSVCALHAWPGWGGGYTAAEDVVLAEKCIAPAELGAIVRDILAQPDHLTVPEVTVQPMVQDICPM